MICIFTDGACSGNPGPGGWAAVVAMPGGSVIELGGREDATTNNRMELTAVIEGLKAVSHLEGLALVHTDSTYVIGGITQWIKGWKRNGWRTSLKEPVKNEDLWMKLDRWVSERGPKGIDWRWVRGHSGHDANERCDAIAVAFAKRQRLELYKGPLIEYPHGSLLPGEGRPPARSSGGSSGPKAPSGPVTYLSYLEGRLERHATWAACESRVKGRSGARFKKVRSPEEEAQTLKGWGL